ncbi:MAG: hypothetical protein ACJ79H_02880 [Myxococcales bacterium]
MLKGTLAVSALLVSLSLAAPAHAAGRDVSVVPPSRSGLAQEVAVVESRPSTAGIIARDAIGGAVLGAAVGGGVAAYRRYVSSEASWGNWQRDVALGAGIGLAAGLLLGAVDAASNADRRFTGPVADERQIGFGAPMAMYGRRF